MKELSVGEQRYQAVWRSSCVAGSLRASRDGGDGRPVAPIDQQSTDQGTPYLTGIAGSPSRGRQVLQAQRMLDRRSRDEQTGVDGEPSCGLRASRTIAHVDRAMGG